MTKRKKTAACSLVLIEWEDSAQPVSAWRHLHSYEPEGAILCASVGWMIHDDERLKVLAPNMGSINRAANLQASGMIQIPTCCVVRITKLEEPAGVGRAKVSGD